MNARERLTAAGIELVEIPPGRYLVGVDEGTPRLARPPARTWPDYPLATRAQWIDIARSFWISRRLVTHRQLAALGVRGTPDDRPVRERFARANEIAASVGASLPRWYEWEIAVRGPEPFLYPWGNELDLSRLTLWTRSYGIATEPWSPFREEPPPTEQVVMIKSFGSYADATSPFGLADLARIGCEWNLCHAGQPLDATDHIVRSFSDAGAMLYMLPGIHPGTDAGSGDFIRSLQQVYSGPIAACYGRPEIHDPDPPQDVDPYLLDPAGVLTGRPPTAASFVYHEPVRTRLANLCFLRECMRLVVRD